MRAVVALTLVLATIVALSTGATARNGAPRQAQAESDCMTDPLGPVPDWNIVVMGDLNLMNTDSEGRIVIGRDATLQNFGVASSYPNDPSRIDLAVGRDLNAVNTGVNHGSATYGRNLFGTLTNPLPNGTITRATTPFDVGALFEALAIRSSFWADLDPNGTSRARSTARSRCRGPTPTRNVFTLSASKLASAQEIRIRVPFGSTTLINVTGETLLEHDGQRDRVLERVGVRAAAEQRAPNAEPRDAADEDGVELARRDRRRPRPEHRVAGHDPRAARGRAARLPAGQRPDRVGRAVRDRRDAPASAQPVPARPRALPAGAADPDPHADADDHPDADAGADEHADARADLDADPDPGADEHADAGAHEHARADRDPDPHARRRRRRASRSRRGRTTADRSWARTPTCGSARR